ncbi:MAG: hypothetical protein DI547_04845 [Sphingobium sp.]|nr:MAG: hypothetical protein DI547_04845 [Sphingobium sp.]
MLERFDMGGNSSTSTARDQFANCTEQPSFAGDALEYLGTSCGREKSLVHHLIEDRLNGQHAECGDGANARMQFCHIVFKSLDTLLVGEHFESPLVSVSASDTITEAGMGSIHDLHSGGGSRP